YGVEIALQRRQPFAVDFGLVEAAAVVIADLLIVRVARAGGRLLDDVAQDRVVPLLQILEAAVARLVGGQRMRLEPAAAGGLVEGGASARAAIERREIDTRLARRRLLLRGQGPDRKAGNEDGERGRRGEEAITIHAMSSHFALCSQRASGSRWLEANALHALIRSSDCCSVRSASGTLCEAKKS